MKPTVHLGFEVGSGNPVEIPLAHIFVAGMTQQSGKTTTLRAIVQRSGARALAFVTKRGEDFEGRSIRPYLPKDGEAPIHWRMVETILASALEQRSLKYERLQIINAAKGARSLEDVQGNVGRLLLSTKNPRVQEVYHLLHEYLELVVPQMKALNASHVLDLQPGLNVMDLTGIAEQTQAMVIRAALERVNHHETGVLTVLPEAWQFAPRGRSAPAKDEAIAMARKGAAPKVRNFLLVDSQDIAGVETVVRQACSVWLLGVQRELNEVKRALAMMDSGIKKPKASEITSLELGQFYACWGQRAVKVYVQPAWMDASEAVSVARGSVLSTLIKNSRPKQEPTVTKDEADRLTRENTELKASNERLQEANDLLDDQVGQLSRRLESLEANRAQTPTPAARPASVDELHQHKTSAGSDALRAAAPGGQSRVAIPTEAMVVAAADAGAEARYQQIKARLLSEIQFQGTTVLQVLAPEKLRKEFQRDEVARIIQTVRELNPLARKTLKLLESLEGSRLTQVTINERLGRSVQSKRDMSASVSEMAELGFVNIDKKNGVAACVRTKVAADLATYSPTDAEVEACYQAVLHVLATDASL